MVLYLRIDHHAITEKITIFNEFLREAEHLLSGHQRNGGKLSNFAGHLNLNQILSDSYRIHRVRFLPVLCMWRICEKYAKSMRTVREQTDGKLMDLFTDQFDYQSTLYKLQDQVWKAPPSNQMTLSVLSSLNKLADIPDR